MLSATGMVRLGRPPGDGFGTGPGAPHGLGIDRVIAPPHVLVAFLRDGGTVRVSAASWYAPGVLLLVVGDSFRRICTDQVFHAKLTLRFPVLFSGKCWDRYRQHPDSSCQKIAAEEKPTLRSSICAGSSDTSPNRVSAIGQCGWR